VVRFVHERYDIDSIALFQGINASYILANAPDGVVAQPQRGADGNVASDPVRKQRDGFSKMLFAKVIQQLFYAQADLAE